MHSLTATKPRPPAMVYASAARSRNPDSLRLLPIEPAAGQATYRAAGR